MVDENFINGKKIKKLNERWCVFMIKKEIIFFFSYQKNFKN